MRRLIARFVLLIALASLGLAGEWTAPAAAGTPPTYLPILPNCVGPMVGNGASPMNCESVSSLLDTYLGSTQGSLAYRNATGWTALAPGTSGYFLETLGVGANPIWAAGGGGSGGGITIGATISGACPASDVIYNNAGVIGCTAGGGSGTLTLGTTPTSGFTSGDIITSSGSTLGQLSPTITINSTSCPVGGSCTVTAGSGGTGFLFQSDNLTVTATNTLSALSKTYTAGYLTLYVNGAAYDCVGGSSACSASGTTVTWNSTNANFSLTTSGYLVYANYTYNGGVSTGIVVGATPVTGGTSGYCLTESGGTVGATPCGGGLSFPQTVSGTTNSGGVPYFSSTTVLTSSATLTANALMIGGGAGGAPSTTTTGSNVLTALGNAINAASGLPNVDGSITTGDCLKWGPGVQDAGAACGGAGSISFPQTVSGSTNSGGIPYFSSSTQLTTSGVLASGALMAGGGAGASPYTITTGSNVVTALGNAINAASGLPNVSGSITTGDCLKWGPGVKDAGSACGGGPTVWVACQNTSGDSTLIQSAISSVSGGGTVVTYGTCYLTTAISQPYSNVTVAGMGSGQTIWQTTLTSGDLLSVGSASESAYIQFCKVKGITFQPVSGYTRTSGAAIHKYSTNRCTFEDIDIENMYIGMILSADNGFSGSGDYNTYVLNSFIETNSLYGIQIGSSGSTYSTHFPQGIQIENTDISVNGVGLYVLNVGGLTTYYAQGINNGIGESIVPGTSQYVGQFSTNDQWDTNTGSLAGLNIEPTGGVVAESSWENLWVASGASANGIVLNYSSGLISNLNFTNCHIDFNGKFGAYIGNGQYMTFSNCSFSGNGDAANNTYDGLSINSPAAHVQIIGGVYGSNAAVYQGGTTPSNKQRYGVSVENSVTYVTIEGADTTGNATAASGCTAAFGSVGSSIFCGTGESNIVIGGNQ